MKLGDFLGWRCWVCALVLYIVLAPAQLQKTPKRRMINSAQRKEPVCCEGMRELRAQVANLSSLLEELGRKQEGAWVNVLVQVMELEGAHKLLESRLGEAESRYSELDQQLDIMELQAAQAVTQSSTDAIYDCYSLSQKNYKISGVYKLPADQFMRRPELEVFCDMETDGGGWTLIQRRKIGLTSFQRDWKQYKVGFGNIKGDFWLGNENIHHLSQRPTTLRIELEDWEGHIRYAQYSYFSISNEYNSYRLLLGHYNGTSGQDSLRYHNNTAFSTMDKDNDKCLDHCAQLRKGGYWYNCCTDSNLNGIFYRKGEHTQNVDGISWYSWHGSSYSLRRVEMKIRPQEFSP
ncbi:angiopoietin-related protein 7 [Ambystoma mexicanum]|uniref:angiopoietin-related protein 7 n=1 Tax=Ambystoma mexicanum TaxID=8296 RepID=UPI0037E9021F